MPVLFVNKNVGILFLKRFEALLDLLAFTQKEAETKGYTYFGTMKGEDFGVSTGVLPTLDVTNYFNDHFNEKVLSGNTSFSQLSTEELSYFSEYFKNNWQQGVSTVQIISSTSYFEMMKEEGGLSAEQVESAITYFEEMLDLNFQKNNSFMVEQIQSLIDYFATLRK